MPSQAQTVELLPGGLEYSQELGEDAFAAVELSYQGATSWSDLLLGDDRKGDRENELTATQDPLALSLSGGWDRRNDLRNPTQGSKLELGVEQTIPLRQGDVASNRVTANYTQWVPLPVGLPGIAKGDQTLVLNVQGGSVLSDASRFELGGANSVRGYGEGDLGSGKRFVQATAEYRFPLLSAESLDVGGGLPLGALGLGRVGGAVFVDYANVVGGTADGQRNQGLGVGAGVNTPTPLGLMRLELAVNDQREAKLGFRLGDRF